MLLDSGIASRKTSESIYSRSCEVIPQGVNSPVRAFRGVKEAPMVAARALGDEVIDSDGNSYVDYCCSWGALILGHADPEIVQAASERLSLGSTFGITTEVEAQLAEKVVSLVPSIEKIRFVSSGTEATMSAARLARGYTGRHIIIKFIGCYHGHADFFLVQAGSGVAGLTGSSSAGVPADHVKHTLCLPFNDAEAVRRVFKDPAYADCIAGVIVEPIAGNMGVVPGTPEFLNTLREETEKAGALLIFDEVMTGFRVGLTGAQGRYGITPDLSCFGKVIGGGFPAAAFGGRAEIMDHLAPEGNVYQAGTLSGNPVAMEAGLRTLERVAQPGFYETLERKTLQLVQPLQAFFEEKDINACVQQVGSMFTVFCGRRSVSNMAEAMNCTGYVDLFSHLFKRGIYFPPIQVEACFLTAAHTDDHIDYTLQAIQDYFK